MRPCMERSVVGLASSRHRLLLHPTMQKHRATLPSNDTSEFLKSRRCLIFYFTVPISCFTA